VAPNQQEARLAATVKELAQLLAQRTKAVREQIIMVAIAAVAVVLATLEAVVAEDIQTAAAVAAATQTPLIHPM
jgi:hypothetical protein